MTTVESIQQKPDEAGAAPPLADLPPTAQLVLAPASDAREAELLTARLAHSHYENFSVVSRLLPRRLRQDFCNVYAFCRTADDLGDEVGDRVEARILLARFRDDLTETFQSRPRSLVFTALATTIRRHDIPAKP